MSKGQSAAKLLNDENIGKTFGVLTILEYSYTEKSKTFYKCLCNRCGNETIVRTNRGNYSPKSCTHCVNSLQKEIADSKYLELRKYKNIYNSYKGNANTKNREFNLTFEDIVKFVDSECYYCGDKDSQGIDRIDSNLGYTLNNTIPCCKICNQMKHVFTNDIFLSKIKLIYEKHLKESSTTIP